MSTHTTHLRRERVDARNGFTLIELLLYVSISAILLGVSMLFLQTLLEARIKNQTIAEVDQQGVQVMQVITQALRNASYVSSPATSTSAVSLSIATSTPTLTTFDLSEGTLRMTEGSNPPVSLTNARVTVSDLVFTNLSRTATPGIVQAVFTITYMNDTGRNERTFSKKFIGSASLRHP